MAGEALKTYMYTLIFLLKSGLKKWGPALYATMASLALVLHAAIIIIFIQQFIVPHLKYNYILKIPFYNSCYSLCCEHLANNND